jgi:hypothetical protein
MCDHKQVTEDMFGVKEGESKNKQVPKHFSDTLSDFKMAEVPVQKNYIISDTTPISKPIIYGEHIIASDHKKAAPSIEGHSPFHEPTKSKGSVVEEVKFVVSQIDFSSKRSQGQRKEKQRSQLKTYRHLQIFLHKEASSFLKLQYTVSTAKTKWFSRQRWHMHIRRNEK